MASNPKHGNEDKGDGSSGIEKNLDGWKFPKIPVDQVYKKKPLFKIFPSYSIKEKEETITIEGNKEKVNPRLLSNSFLRGFIKKKHRFVHIGLVQIAIKPLQRDGLGAPIVVCLRDERQSDFQNSLLALVEANLSQGPFYFNCFPSFSVATSDVYNSKEVVSLYVKTSGIPLALAYRVVCKSMVELNAEALKDPVLGETASFQPATGARTITKWDEVQVLESWACKPEPLKPRTFSKNGFAVTTYVR